jgi:hypothetical protein
MIDRQSIADIVATYGKHGWTLRRVLLSERSAKTLGSLDVFGDAQVEDSPVDAMWFSRRARRGFETWELRAISLSPFALLENIPDEMPANDADAVFRDAEQRLAETVIKPSPSDLS